METLKIKNLKYILMENLELYKNMGLRKSSICTVACNAATDSKTNKNHAYTVKIWFDPCPIAGRKIGQEV